MELIKIGIIIGVLAILLGMKKSMFVTLTLSAILGFVLFSFSWDAVVNITIGSITSSTTLSMVALIFFIAYLQAFMTKHDKLSNIDLALTGLFRNKQINVPHFQTG